MNTKNSAREEFISIAENTIYSGGMVRCRNLLSKRMELIALSEKLSTVMDDDIRSAIFDIVDDCLQVGITAFFNSVDDLSEDGNRLRIIVDGVDVSTGNLSGDLHDENGWTFKVKENGCA